MYPDDAQGRQKLVALNRQVRFQHCCLFSGQETMENVKKCKNFLSTLIKLASSGKQSSETAANVKDLVKNLLVCMSLQWK